MEKEHCAICRIVAKDTSAPIVYETADTIAFLELTPDTTGHTVVSPKEHVYSIDEASGSFRSIVMDDIKKTMDRLDAVLHPGGFTVGWNHGVAGGQKTPHWHIHILPRWENDGGGTIHSVVQYTDMPVAEVAELFS